MQHLQLSLSIINNLPNNSFAEQETKKWISNSNRDVLYANGSEHNSFFYCNIILNDNYFQNCEALGPSLIYGTGGAFYAYFSSVSVRNCSFNSCYAISGGALSLKSSAVRIKSSHFSYCSAWKQCGALYLRNNDEVGIFESNFTNCFAVGSYGAIGAHNCCEFVMSDCSFDNNSAELSGGAIGLRDTKAFLLKVQFNDNHLVPMRLSNISELIKETKSARGGAAIVFIMDSKFISFQDCWKSRYLVTSECTFENNYINLMSYLEGSSGLYASSGTDITFLGFSVWQSNSDTFNYMRNVSIRWVLYENSEKGQWTETNAVQITGNTAWGNGMPNNTNVVHFYSPPTQQTDISDMGNDSGSGLPEIGNSSIPSASIPVQHNGFEITLANVIPHRRATLIDTDCPNCFNNPTSYISPTTPEHQFDSSPPIEEKDDGLIWIIVAAVGCVILVGTVIAITVYFHTSEAVSGSEEEDSSNGGLMQAEVRSIDQAESTVVSQNNPLWDRRGGADISDDPFANDFVEDTMLTIEI